MDPATTRTAARAPTKIIKAQDQHLKELVKAGDDAHLPAREDMKGRWRRPLKSISWYTDVKKRFAELPEK